MTGGADRPAKQWALRALSRRMHTVNEIEGGLVRRGWPPETVGRVVDDLLRAGYLNDQQFAEMWVEGRSEAKLHGYYRLIHDLRAKGVDERLARSVTDRLLPRQKEITIARKAAARKARLLKRRDVGALASLHRYLMARGFRSDVIREVLSWDAIEEEPS